MKSFLRALVLLPIAAVLLAFSFANRHLVSVSLDPFDSQSPAYEVRAPLYVILFATVMIGVFIGGVASWWSQGKYRRAARRYRAEAERLRAEAIHTAPEVAGRSGGVVRMFPGSTVA